MDQKFEDLRGKGPDGFPGIPENYFKELPDKLVIIAREKNNIKPHLFVRPAFRAIAAVMLIIISIGVLLIIDIADPDKNIIVHNQPAIEHPEQLTEINGISDSDISLVEKDTLVIKPEPSLSSDPANGFDDLFAELDEIPFDVILDYLAEADEFEF
ncbi:MAG: hypothetical protein IH597_06495 [Bacteroidales bacterium]|nr:hypothetical protein [Bacteroidales bacterium]